MTGNLGDGGKSKIQYELKIEKRNFILHQEAEIPGCTKCID